MNASQYHCESVSEFHILETANEPAAYFPNYRQTLLFCFKPVIVAGRLCLSLFTVLHDNCKILS